MDAQTIDSPVIKINCDRCGQVSSRRGALTAEVQGREEFLCSACANEFAEYFNLSWAERPEYYKWFINNRKYRYVGDVREGGAA